MKRYKYTYTSGIVHRVAGILISTFLSVMCLHAASPEKYAASSVLAKGKWVKIDISTPGLQTLSKQTLKNFGFDNPKSVYVYGYGGRMISETLSTDHPDDLPPVPFIIKDDGSITFYAVGNIGPQVSFSSAVEYEHVINPYGDTSYYFLSDVAPEGTTQTIDLSDCDGLPEADSFICQLVHERDLLQCATSGRNYFGEDFKSNRSQEFDFSLPDNITGNAKIRIRFATNTSTNTSSSYTVSANGKQLPATSGDVINGVSSSEQYYRSAISTKTAEDVGNALTVGIDYNPSGVVSTARLDWIEVEYERELTLRNSQLYFQVKPRVPTAYTISGVSDKTVIWDVTKPWDIKTVKGSFNADDKTITIGLKDAGMREFIAFEPTAKGATIPGRIKMANQNIHGLQTPHMVIITPDEYAAASERIANLHRTYDGMTVHVLSPEKIYNEFSSGNADLSAFRKLLKMWYDRSQADPEGNQFGYCLIMGRPTYDQKMKNPETIKSGYPRVLIWQSPTGETEGSSYCTDDFIAMLEDEKTATSMQLRKQLVAVGRYPVTSAYEADIIADKLEAYMTAPIYGSWRNNVMLIADDGNSAAHLNQSEKAVKKMMASEAGSHYAYEKIYLDAFERKETSAGLTFPEAKERMLMKWQKEGVSLINYIGHANPKEWGHEKILTWTDINNMSNQYLPILYAATCSFGKWDAEEISGAEILLNNPAGGIISAITPSRTVIIAKNEYITNSISDEFFRRDSLGRAQRLGDILRIGKNLSTYPSDNILRYHLFGDPAMRMPVPNYNILIDSIGDRPVAENIADSPSVSARSSLKISGRITDASGETVDFNGPLQFTLFDAEKSVETHGWGDDGIVQVYQDRSSKLATGSCMVTDGRWSTTILMPSEIANNYSPALITTYAYDERQQYEASGSTDRLFVYGYNYDAAEDKEGPEIERFGVNSLSDNGKKAVDSNPVAIAEFSDESGISISDAAIGHKMSLILDKEKVYDDVCNYYIPDPEDNTRGRIVYPLIDLEPGEHELTLTVWDNANNSSNATINFNVGLNLHPEVTDISTYYNRTSNRLYMKVSTDRSLCGLACKFECFDLSGQLRWQLERKVYAGSDSSFSYFWNLKDINGNRVPKGIYVLRATVESEDGLKASKSKKIAIPAQ